MNRIAVISDIHGNIPALNAVLDDIDGRGIESIICLGDLAGKGPSSSLAVDIIRERCKYVIKGNWDFFLSEKESDMLKWHQTQLGEERLEYLKELPVYHEFFMSGRLVRLCHASPNDLFHRTYIRTDWGERLRLFEPTGTSDRVADVIGYGDIHGAYIENFEGKMIFNAGSVGNPLDITQSSYAIMEGVCDGKESASLSVSLVRIPYDIEEAVRHAFQSDMPEREEYIKELQTGIYRGRRV